MFKFMIRDLLWLTMVVGLALGWGVDHTRLTTPARLDDIVFEVDSPKRYTLRTVRASDLAEKITTAEAKAMLVRFVEESKVAQGAEFIRQSLPILKRTEMTEVESGDYVCGPWQVNPHKNTATLTTDLDQRPAFQLVTYFPFKDGKWSIVRTKIIEIRP
jgi:hypothetical protein